MLAQAKQHYNERLITFNHHRERNELELTNISTMDIDTEQKSKMTTKTNKILETINARIEDLNKFITQIDRDEQYIQQALEVQTALQSITTIHNGQQYHSKVRNYVSG